MSVCAQPTWIQLRLLERVKIEIYNNQTTENVTPERTRHSDVGV